MIEPGSTDNFDIHADLQVLGLDIKGVCKILQDGRTLCKVQPVVNGQAQAKLNFVIDRDGKVAPFQFMGPAKNVNLASPTIERTKAYLIKIGKTLGLTS